MTYRYAFVINKMGHDFEDVYKGEKIRLKPNEKIKMTRGDAVALLGVCTADERNLEIIPILEPEQHISVVTGEKFNSKEDLEKHYLSVKDSIKQKKG